VLIGFLALALLRLRYPDKLGEKFEEKLDEKLAQGKP
jgi:hypothetical protein